MMEYRVGAGYTITKQLIAKPENDKERRGYDHTIQPGTIVTLIHSEKADQVRFSIDGQKYWAFKYRFEACARPVDDAKLAPKAE